MNTTLKKEIERLEAMMWSTHEENAELISDLKQTIDTKQEEEKQEESK